jgi:hypothetical protein
MSCGPRVYENYIKHGPLKLRWRADIRREKGYAQDRSESLDLKWAVGNL